MRDFLQKYIFHRVKTIAFCGIYPCWQLVRFLLIPEVGACALEANCCHVVDIKLQYLRDVFNTGIQLDRNADGIAEKIHDIVFQYHGQKVLAILAVIAIIYHKFRGRKCPY